MENEERHQFMVFLLFSGEKQYGLLACDIDQEDFPFFYVISLQIGLSLHYLEISKAEAARRLEMSRDMEEIKEKTRFLGFFPVLGPDRTFESAWVYGAHQAGLPGWKWPESVYDLR